jgi:hypothetical protein
LAKPKIKVVMNIPDMKYAENLKTKALADIIIARINKLPYEQRKAAKEYIEREYERGKNKR